LLNLVERWFRDLTDKALRRGVFPSAPDLVAAIENYLAVKNADPNPFIWTGHPRRNPRKGPAGRVALDVITNYQ
jgi:hypothetical protein